MDVASYKPGCAQCTPRFFTSGACGCRGLSLIELMLALAVSAILLTYALPALGNLLAQQRKTSAINTLLTTLYYTRSEAILRGREVVLCKSRDNTSCVRSGEWQQGWLVFEDRNGNRLADDDEAILSSQGALEGVVIYYRAFGSNHYVVYQPSGVTNTNGTYTFCTTPADDAPRALILYKTGRARTSTVRSDNSALHCPP